MTNKTGEHEPSMATGRSLGWLLDHRVATRGDYPFLVWEPFDGRRLVWTYREFATDVRRVGAGLAARGIGWGDRILLHMENSPEFLLIWFACARLGAVPVCTNSKSAADEMSYFGEHSEVVGAVTQPSFAGLVGRALPFLPWTVVTATDKLEVGAARSGDQDSFLSLYGEDAGTDTVNDDRAPAWIQYTSGTTSRPKAVVLTHANGLWGAKTTARNEGLRPDDVHFVHLPLFHINAICYSILTTMWVGGSVVLVPRFSASRFWDTSRRNNCTWASVIPFCTQALLTVDPPEAHTYRLWGNGINIPAEMQPWGIRNLGWYGMTETVAHPVIDDVEVPGPFGSMGRPAPGYQVEVRRDDGTLAEPEEQGGTRRRVDAPVDAQQGLQGRAPRVPAGVRPGRPIPTRVEGEPCCPFPGPGAPRIRSPDWSAGFVPKAPAPPTWPSPFFHPPAPPGSRARRSFSTPSGVRRGVLTVGRRWPPGWSRAGTASTASTTSSGSGGSSMRWEGSAPSRCRGYSVTARSRAATSTGRSS